MAEQMSRRTVKGEDPRFFDIALQLVEGFSNTKRVCNPSTSRVKRK